MKSRNRKQNWDDGQELTCWSKELRKEYWKVQKTKNWEKDVMQYIRLGQVETLGGFRTGRGICVMKAKIFNTKVTEQMHAFCLPSHHLGFWWLPSYSLKCQYIQIYSLEVWHNYSLHCNTVTSFGPLRYNHQAFTLFISIHLTSLYHAK